MYKVISYKERSVWEEKLSQLNKRDLFYQHTYCMLNQFTGDGDPFLFFYEDGSGNRLCYAFLRRKINVLEFMKEETESDIYDIITPSYGYGGPLFNELNTQFLIDFRREFESYCKKENIICEFIRFHPLYQNQSLLETLMDISYDRETIFVDLTKSEDEIYHDYHKNHKRNMNKASKNQLKFKVFQHENRFHVIEKFYEMYKNTMNKVKASSYSYFSLDYLEELIKGFYHESMIGAVYHNERMIAAAICLYDGNALHYHLGCSEEEFLNLGSNVYLLHNIAIWGKRNGLSIFHLGGGHIGRDSLFQFKHRFNPSGTLPFYIGKKVHDPILYNHLVAKWENYYQQKSLPEFFPAYRGKVRTPENSYGN
ncbi:GNAT family N-acetyltransferase [Bacillus sp. FJAT-49736]|uniref:GNAT family N-acetyltransferase n=1 Tax=Bacillus sp. FJAT-49736 TaxID=2833582 RepID=UPI001BCA0135|nr:GNAT family N-acetyltransferase [Bacillus sp. FJAT-49736]MBS4172947.1 GNAT family N-acetyltransferase [Bacillus sp. FJAT-49736]